MAAISRTFSAQTNVKETMSTSKSAAGIPALAQSNPGRKEITRESETRGLSRFWSFVNYESRSMSQPPVGRNGPGENVATAAHYCELPQRWLYSLIMRHKILQNVFLTQIRADSIDTFARQLSGTGVAVPPQCVTLSRQWGDNASAVRVNASATKHKFKPLIRRIKGLELADSSFNSLIGGEFRWHVGSTILAISFGSIECKFKSVLGVW
ncbi:hypothetical protein DFH08DRAFT_802137 [Mycena albidolilacea]|uniref:Uncharacterized protein n=1 Tax=Mycena albidolilacea TaxID=1033008 RepID=A0AAD7F063_9AGAR|nr:hypothetical protein DFH08DRAFT_802137 [Mycena albidolilacea]